VEQYQAHLGYVLGAYERPAKPLTEDEEQLVASAKQHYSSPINQHQHNTNDTSKKSNKRLYMRGIIPAMGAVITMIATKKAYNIAYKQIKVEFAAAQEKAEQEGLPPAPEMTQWQLRKAAAKRTAYNIRKDLFKKHKLFFAGATLLIGGGLYDFGSSL
jgi:hypothetical protein